MVCDHSDFRLKLAAGLGFETCNTANESFEVHAASYFGTSASLSGKTLILTVGWMPQGAGSHSDRSSEPGKIESRFVSVAVNNAPSLH